MKLQVQDLALPGLRLITPYRSRDARGFFCETYSARAFADAGIALEFVQDNHSFSAEAGTVRGLHFQAPPDAQAKLIRVTRGRILDVALDIRNGSPTYGEHAAVELSDENWTQLFVPEGFAHGFCTLAPNTEVIYKVTAYYAPGSERGLFWSDPALGIAWPRFAGSYVSPKDASLPKLADVRSPFTFSH